MLPSNSYSIFGSKSFSKVCFYFHGFPGSHVEAEIFAKDALELGLTLIALDRPGFGDVAIQPDRQIHDWPIYVLSVAKFFNISKFSVIGMSGGAPYAAARAAMLGNELESVTIISGMGQIINYNLLQNMPLQNKLLFLLSKRSRSVCKIPLKIIGTIWKTSPFLSRHWLRMVTHKADRILLSKPENIEILNRNLSVAFKHGVEGAIIDFMLMASPWQFDISKSNHKIYLWHGLVDNYVPSEMCQYYSDNFSNCETEYIPDGGHFMVLNRPLLNSILSKLNN